jgi:hypothetical protein
VAADRAAFAGKSGMAVSGDGELLNDVATGRVKLEAVPKAELPAEIQDLPLPAQKAWVERKNIERQRVLDEINNVAAARSGYLREEAKKARRADGFDDEVRKSIKAQAAEAAVVY